MSRAAALLLLPALAGACRGSAGDACKPGAVEACYDGPAATRGVGVCRAGKHACLADGSGFAACVGEVLPSVQLCDTPEDESCDGSSPCAGIVRWARSFGDGAAQTADLGASLGVDGILVGGTLQGTVDFGGGAVVPAGAVPSPYLAAFDGDAGLRWIRLLGTFEGTTTVSSAFAGPDGGVVAAGWVQGSTDLGTGKVTGTGDVDGFLLALDARGDVRWTKVFTGAGDQRLWVGPPDAGGALVVTAVFSGRLDFGDAVLTSAHADPQIPDLVAARLDASGRMLWSASASGGFEPLLEEGYVVPVPAVAGTDGSIFVAAGVLGELEIAGSAGPVDATSPVTLLLDLDRDGLVWSQVFAGEGVHVPSSLALSPDGAIVLSTGIVDAASQVTIDTQTVAKIDPTGLPLWSQDLGPVSPGGGVSVDPSGAVVVAGLSSQPVAFGGDTTVDGGFFVGKLDALGNALWARTFGYGFLDARVGADAYGGARVAGTFAGTVQVGDTTLTSAGASADTDAGAVAPDIFMLEVSP
jgi:hypothetical protein